MSSVEVEDKSDKQERFAKLSTKEDDMKIVNLLCTISTLSTWPRELFHVIVNYYRTIYLIYVFGGSGQGIGKFMDQTKVSSSEGKIQSNCGRLIDGVWDDLAPMMPPRFGHASQVIGDYMYIVGGGTLKRSTNNHSTASAIVTRLHISTSTWSLSAHPLPEPRYYHGCVVVDDNLYCLGGYDGDNICGSIFRYNTLRNTWIVMSPMMRGRIQSSYAVMKNRIYAFGGYHERSCEFYDIAKNQWSYFRHDPNIVIATDCRSVVVGNTILLMGGEIFEGQGYVDLVVGYSPELNRWCQMNWKLPHSQLNFVAWYESETKLLYVAYGYSVDRHGNPRCDGNIYARRMTNKNSTINVDADVDVDDPLTDDWMIVSTQSHSTNFGYYFSSAVVTC